MERSADISHGLWEAFGRARDPHARTQLIEHYMPFARVIAIKAYGLRPKQSAAFDDYLQYARVGLIEAIDRFDVSRSVSFELYSTHRIRGAILSGIGHESETAAQRSFWRTRRADRMESVVAAGGINVQRASLHELIDLTVAIVLGLVLDESENDPIDESPQANPYAATELAQLSGRIRQLVEVLPERERDIIKGHYFERLEFQAIAQRFALTKGRVSQLHGQAIIRLRRLLNARPRLDRTL